MIIMCWLGEYIHICSVFQFNDNRVFDGKINIYKGVFKFLIIMWWVGK